MRLRMGTFVTLVAIAAGCASSPRLPADAQWAPQGRVTDASTEPNWPGVVFVNRQLPVTCFDCWARFETAVAVGADTVVVRDLADVQGLWARLPRQADLAAAAFSDRVISLIRHTCVLDCPVVVVSRPSDVGGGADIAGLVGPPRYGSALGRFRAVFSVRSLHGAWLVTATLDDRNQLHLDSLMLACYLCA